MERQKRAAEVGVVMGVVLVVMGFAYGNSSIWTLGLILLAIGGIAKTRGGPGEQE